MSRSYTGLFDQVPFPERLRGHVVDPREVDPRVHGYAVQADLAVHASFVEVGWLALTGDLPTAAQRAALEVALIWLMPVHVGEGAAHAGVLARIAGAPDAVLPGVVGTALGQQATAELAVAQEVFAWLDGGAQPPEAAQSDDPAAWDALVAASVDWFERPLPARPALGRVAGAYALLHRLGITDGLRLQAFAAWARLPVVLAEAARAQPGAVTTYPARLPDYCYVEDR